MEIKKWSRRVLSYIATIALTVQPMTGLASSRGEAEAIRAHMKEYFRATGFHTKGMTFGDFVRVTDRALPPGGAKLIRELSKSILGKQMPRMEISANPFLRINFYSRGQVYTLEVVNSSTHFARLNGELISWVDLVTAEKLITQVYDITSQKPAGNSAAFTLLSLLMPVAHADEAPEFSLSADPPSQESASAGVSPSAGVESIPDGVGDMGEGVQSDMDDGDDIPRPGSAPNSADSEGSATMPAYEQKQGGFGQFISSPGGMITVALVGIALFAASGLGKRSEKNPEPQVIVIPPPATEKEEPVAESRFSLGDVAGSLPTTNLDEMVSGVRVREPASTIAPRGETPAPSTSYEAIF